MAFFPKTPNESPKFKTFIVSKFWMFIYSSNQTCLEHARGISYSPQKNISNGISYILIKDHFTLALRGFVVESHRPFF
jgi:hypothetical protein